MLSSLLNTTTVYHEIYAQGAQKVKLSVIVYWAYTPDSAPYGAQGVFKFYIIS